MDIVIVKSRMITSRWLKKAMVSMIRVLCCEMAAHEGMSWCFFFFSKTSLHIGPTGMTSRRFSGGHTHWKVVWGFAALKNSLFRQGHFLAPDNYHFKPFSSSRDRDCTPLFRFFFVCIFKQSRFNFSFWDSNFGRNLLPAKTLAAHRFKPNH